MEKASGNGPGRQNRYGPMRTEGTFSVENSRPPAHDPLTSVRQAIARDPDDPARWRDYVDALTSAEDVPITPKLIDELTVCLQSPMLATDATRTIAAGILMRQSLVKSLKPGTDGLHFANFMEALQDDELWASRDELSHPLFTALLAGDRISSAEVEAFLSIWRRHLLEFAAAGNLDVVLWPGAVDFLSALAVQGFLTEYAYLETDKETADIGRLTDTVAKALKSGAGPAAEDVALLGAYRLLGRMEFAPALRRCKVLTAVPAMANLFKVQIDEPLDEDQRRGAIPRLTAIQDGISDAVRGQYEENPYPRWSVARAFEPVSAIDYLSRALPFLADKSPRVSDPPHILVAGCGTGRGAIEHALMLPQARITATDLSLTSLAFASRMADALQATNITFGQADILEMGDGSERYDMIICSGVLHHLRTPEDGLDILAGLLKKDGVMKLGLYSDLARRPLAAAREFIAAKDYPAGVGGLRRGRADIMALPQDDEARAVMEWRDFYTTSSYRDLILHVQETRTSIPEIRRMLDTRNLRFLGFNDTGQKRFQPYFRRFPDDPKGLNLDNWAAFEADAPDTFRGMYQFWITGD